MEKIALALDPGYSKVGMALVAKDDLGVKLLWRKIAQRDQLASAMEEARQVKGYQLVVVGSGTRSKEMIRELRETHPGLSLMVVEEYNSTVEARTKYWEHHPRRGIRRFFPASFWPPKEPLDDFAALVLAERALVQ